MGVALSSITNKGILIVNLKGFDSPLQYLIRCNDKHSYMFHNSICIYKKLAIMIFLEMDWC